MNDIQVALLVAAIITAGIATRGYSHDDLIRMATEWFEWAKKLLGVK